MNKPFMFLFTCAIINLCSCDIFREAPFYVVSCLPEQGLLEQMPEEIVIELSQPTSLESAMYSFQLSNTSGPVSGSMSVEENIVIFKPWQALEASQTYTIYVGEYLKARDGQVLERPFVQKFYTQLPQRDYLKLISLTPPQNEEDSLDLCFSHALSPECLLQSLRFVPETSFTVLSTEVKEREEGEKGENGEAGRFSYSLRPRYNWTVAWEYQMNIQQELCSKEGHRLEASIEKNFSIEEKEKRLSRLQIYSADGDILLSLLPEDLQKEGEIASISQLPVDIILALFWEEDVVLARVDSALLIDGQKFKRTSARLALEPGGPLVDFPGKLAVKSAHALWALPVKPAWGSSMILELAPAILGQSEDALSLALVFDDPLGRPPEVLALRYHLFDGNSPVQSYLCREADSFDLFYIDSELYPLNVPRPFSFELFISCVPDALPDLFWLLENTSVQVDSAALGLSYISFKDEGFSVADVPQGLENCWRGEFLLQIVNRDGQGLIRFQLPKGLADSKGAVSEKEFTLILQK